MNLILAVIIFSFIKTQKREIESEIKALNDIDDNNNEIRPHSDTSNINGTIVKEEISGDDFTSNINVKKQELLIEKIEEGGKGTDVLTFLKPQA
jgi:hypothetical protein